MEIATAEGLPIRGTALDRRNCFVFAVLSLVIAFVVHWKDLGVEHFTDDVESHLPRMGRYEAGETTVRQFLFDRHNEHYLPAWFVWYYAEYKLAKTNLIAWHVPILVMHWLGGLCVFGLLRHYLTNGDGAWVAGLLWSMASFGMWDQPIVWIAASHLTFAVCCLLLAMCTLTQIGSERSLVFASAMSGLIVLAVGFMSSIWILTLVLPVQWCLLVRKTSVSQGRLLTWLIAWAAPVCILGVIVLTQTPGTDSAARPDRSIWRGGLVSVGEYAVAGGLLIAPSGNERISLLIFVLLCFGVMGVAIRKKVSGEALPGNRGVVLLFLFLSGHFTLVACYFRSDQPAAQVMSWSRYRYLPTMFWAVAIGVLADAIVLSLRTQASIRKFRTVVVVLLVALVPLHAKYAYDQWFQWFGPRN